MNRNRSFGATTGGGEGVSAEFVASEISTHAAATTSVHGITDTDELETQDGAQAKADAAQVAAIAASQPLDDDLTAIAALGPNDDDVLQRKSGTWTNRTPAQVKADLGLGISDVGGFGATTAQTSFGASSGNGAASTIARSDHSHGTPSLSSSTPSTNTPGTAGSAGSGSAAAKDDHSHPMAAFGSTSGTFAEGDKPIMKALIDAKGDLAVGTAADTAARLPVGSDGRLLMASVAATEGLSWAAFEPGDVPAAGEFVPPRRLCTQSANALPASGTMVLSYWTADKTETIATATTYTGNVAAGATPTLCRIGIYSVAANGDLTLVASTPNDTALWAVTFSTYAKGLSASFAKVAGQRYAVGILIVTGAALPQMISASFGGTATQSTLCSVLPAVANVLAGQTDLPTSVAVGSLTTNRTGYLCRLTP